MNKRETKFNPDLPAGEGLVEHWTPLSTGRGTAAVGGGRTSVTLWIAAALWLLSVVFIMARITVYSNSPGGPGASPVQWPAGSQVSLDGSRPTLVLFAHPHCPCTRASLGELELLMTQCQGRLTAHVLFIKPTGLTADWAETDLWRKASAIPGVTVHRDDAGVEARRFRSRTSGQATLYDRDGRLMFQGGITLSRGHSGDNAGRSAIVALVHGYASDQINNPVFGCSLFATEAKNEDTACKQ